MWYLNCSINDILELMKTILLSVALAVVFFISAAVFLTITRNPNGNKSVEMTIGNANFKVDIADTPALWAKGLSSRPSLPENAAMLFIFPISGIQNFWMKEMKFPIDIIWIKDNTVVGMILGAEPESGPDYTIFSSPEPVDKVLEINAGLVQKLGIRVEDVIKLE